MKTLKLTKKTKDLLFKIVMALIAVSGLYGFGWLYFVIIPWRGVEVLAWFISWILLYYIIFKIVIYRSKP